jgi:hypothetical protein
MTFATPLIAAVVAAIAIPSLIILYFLKLRRKPMEVSTTLLWKKAILDMQANAPFQRLRRNILLLLQLIVLGLLIAALAQPRTAEQSAGGQRIVIMLDRSASMSATDGEPGFDDVTRLEAAKKQAIERVQGLREPGVMDLGGRGQADEAMVVAFDAAAEIIRPFTSDKRALIDAINSVRVTDAPTSIEEAYRLAQAQRPNRVLVDDAGGTRPATPVEIEGLKSGPGYLYHLFSDGRIPDAEVFRADTQEGEAPTFEFHRVGQPESGNLGIVALRAERAFDDPNRLSVFVGVQNTQPGERSVDVELLVDGTLASVRAVVVPGADAPEPGAVSRPGAGGVVFQLTEPRGVEVRVRLAAIADTPGNALSADDEGVLIVPPAKRSAVALVGPGSLFLAEAMRGLPLSRFETLSPVQYESERAAGTLSRFDVIVLDRYLPTPNTSGVVLDPGRYLLFGAVPPPPQGVESLEEGGSSTIIDWRRNHPVLRSLTLDGLVMGRSRPLRIPDNSGVISLADIPAGPTIVEISDGTVRAIAASFDLGQTNWPFQVGFVVYLGSAIEYLSGNVAEEVGANPRQIAPGGVLSDRLPQGASNVRVLSPSGDSQELIPSLDGRVVYGPIRERGVYRVQWTGPAAETDLAEGSRVTRFYAANLLNADESDIRPADELGLADRVVQARQSTAGRLLELWPFVVLGALAVMLLEWWVYNKKVSL